MPRLHVLSTYPRAVERANVGRMRSQASVLALMLAFGLVSSQVAHATTYRDYCSSIPGGVRVHGAQRARAGGERLLVALDIDGEHGYLRVARESEAPKLRAAGRSIDPTPRGEQLFQRIDVIRRIARRTLAVDQRQDRSREGRVGLTCEFGRQRRQRPLPGRVHRRAMLGKLRLDPNRPDDPPVSA